MVSRVRLGSGDTASKGGGRFLAAPSSFPVFPSGCALLDCALGGGWVVGRTINVVGDSQTGKTLIAEEACANYARLFPKAKIWYLEREAGFDPTYAEAVGFPMKRVKFVRSVATAEGFFRDLEKKVKGLEDDEHALYVVDSLDALSDEAELNREVGDKTYGMAKAKAMSEGFRRVSALMEQKKLTLLIISQVRAKIEAGYGRKVTRAGGKALDFYASQIVYLAHLGRINRMRSGVTRSVAVKIEAKVDKTRLGPPFRDAEFPLYFGFGIDDVAASLKWLIEVKRHRDLDEFKSVKDAKKALSRVEGMDGEEWGSWRKKLRPVVRRVWADIEAAFVMKRRKYE